LRRKPTIRSRTRADKRLSSHSLRATRERHRPAINQPRASRLTNTSCANSCKARVIEDHVHQAGQHQQREATGPIQEQQHERRAQLSARKLFKYINRMASPPMLLADVVEERPDVKI
jgi:hypothetical protein